MNSLEVRAPARVNIIGEHTDYNDGFVLPTSTAIFTRVRATPRDDHVVHVTSHTVAEEREFNLEQIDFEAAVSWIDYVKGVAAELLALGVQLKGADLAIDSEIPLGAGLSSSASLELAVAKALLAIIGQDLPHAELARLCQKAEHNYAGVHCGIMDQYTLACAKEGHAILLDCQSLSVEQVAIPQKLGLILTDSGERHSLAEGAYNNRSDECAAAASRLAEAVPGFASLRQLEEGMLQAHRDILGDELHRRCRHVLTENQRVQDAVLALRSADLSRLGELLNASHRSLRDDFAVSCDAVDALVVAANSSDRVMGSRMVGAGFGGCVLSVCQAEQAEWAAEEIRDKYFAMSGKRPWQHRVAMAPPVRVAGAG